MRVHLFEFHDLEWFPHTWRNLLTDILQFFGTRLHPYRPIVPKLKEALQTLNCTRIVDLCAGASGPLLEIQRRLQQEGLQVQITLTDKFPNREAFERLKSEHIDCVLESVDALDVPPSLMGFRTLFASFHHFPPDQARKLLEDAVRKNQGIGIFEFTERSWHTCAGLLLSPLAVWIATPFIRPFHWQRILWTYLLPVIPVFIMWDGIVSNLRTYTPKELLELCESLPEYRWEAGKAWTWPVHRITYLIGLPVQVQD